MLDHRRTTLGSFSGVFVGIAKVPQMAISIYL